MRILRENCVGVVIDIQEKLVPHISGYETILQRTEVLLAGLNILGVPLLVTEQYRKGLGPTVPQIEAELSSFQPLEKISFSCCDDPFFMEKLNAQHRNEVILSGIEAHVCMLQTSLDLIENGIQPIVVADCTGSRNEMDKIFALERMRQEGAIITSSESILFELTRHSGTDEFRAISKLVK